jgi:hypothetical protein
MKHRAVHDNAVLANLNPVCACMEIAAVIDICPIFQSYIASEAQSNTALNGRQSIHFENPSVHHRSNPYTDNGRYPAE